MPNLDDDPLNTDQKAMAGQLIGGIAHNVNNLLSVIVGNVELLEDQIGNDPELQNKIDAIIEAIDQSATLTIRLLAYSRLQKESAKPRSLHKVILDLEGSLKKSLGMAIGMEVRAGPENNVALVDPILFEGALVDLILNARQAMPRGGKLTLEVSETSPDQGAEGGFVKISVDDTGSGMDETVLKQALEPFFTTKGTGEGFGLGLTMVDEFARQSGGRVEVHSKVGEGTQVAIYLPRSSEAAVEDVGVETVGPAVQSSRSAGKRPGADNLAPGGNARRILVVEDNPEVREIPVVFLHNQGFEVIEAANGELAIEALQSGQTFDLLFADVVLGRGMSGVDVASKATQIQPSIKILLTSGFAHSGVEGEGGLSPQVRLISKPYSLFELLEEVRSVLSEPDH